MKNKILLFTLSILLTTNIFGQLLTFPNANIYTSTLDNIGHIASNGSIVVVGTNDETFPYDINIYTLDKGNFNYLRERDLDFSIVSGGCVGIKRNGSLYEWNLADPYTGELLTNYTGWVQHYPIARKNDTLMFYGRIYEEPYSDYYIQIGTHEPSLLTGINGEAKAFWIKEDTAIIYTLQDYPNMKRYAYPFDNLTSPVIKDLSNHSISHFVFCENYALKQVWYEDYTTHTFLWNENDGWQQIDDAVFDPDNNGWNDYTYYTLSNDINDNLVISAINGYGNDVIQIYTEGLISTSINKTSTKDISIYPNPTSGKITINTNENITSIEVLDISGKKIFETQKKELDITNYENGTYILKVKTKNSTFTKKIIKK